MSAVAVRELREAEVFSLERFERWIDENELRLDNGDDWVLEPFQREVAEDILGLPRETWVIIPEANAKTTLMAGLGLFFGDLAGQPWIPIGAASRDQAEIMFGQMAVFVEQSNALKARFRVFEGYRKIRCPGGGRGIKVYASDAKTGDGVIPYPVAFVDELHRHDDLRLYRLWKGKLTKRGGGIVTISTAGEPGSEFEETRETIRSRATHRHRDGCHLRAEGAGIIYHEWMVPDVKAASNLEVVKQANPLGQITVETLVDKLASPTLNFGEDWLRLTCNIPSRSSTVAIPEANWDALEVADKIPAGQPVAVGADFAWLWDTTALAPLWMRDREFRLFGAPTVLEPPRDGTMLNPDLVKDAFRAIHGRNPIQYVVMDKTKAEDIAGWLENELGVTVVDRSQGNVAQVLDYKRFMEGVGKQWIRHTGDRVFRQHVLNAIARKVEGDNYRFDRPSTSRSAKRQERRVIDALTAAAMVHSTAVAEFDEQPSSGWRGL